MSVQTTVTITREQAEAKWVEARLEKYRKTLTDAAKECTNEELEDLIEEHFYNYTINEE